VSRPLFPLPCGALSPPPFLRMPLPPEFKFSDAPIGWGRRRKEPDIRIKALIAVLSLAAAFEFVALVPAALAQPTTPAAAEKRVAPMKPSAALSEEVDVSVAEKAQRCLKIGDKTDDRLHCYDDTVRPQPNPKPQPVKGIRNCRHIVDVDQLSCFDGFAVQIPKFTH
jgi:hypothetical protein